MYKFFTAAALLAFAGFTHTDDAVDWKLYAVTQSPNNALFYLSNDITRSGNTVQVWMKALSGEKLKALDVKDVADSTAHLVILNYEPPLMTLEKLSDDARLTVITYEQVADANLVTPLMKALYEIDCAKKLYRTLTFVTQTQSESLIRPWEHIPPESTMASLRKLTCRAS